MGYLVETVATGHHLEDPPHGLHVLVWRKSGLFAIVVNGPGEAIRSVSTARYLTLACLPSLPVHEPVADDGSFVLRKRVQHRVRDHVPSIVQRHQPYPVFLKVLV